MAEYALVLAFVIAFLYAIRGYFTTSMSGTITAGVDNYVKVVQDQQIGTVNRYAPNTESNSNSQGNTSYNGDGSANIGGNVNSNQDTNVTY